MSLVKPLFVASIASHPDDDQHELNHRPPSADGDPTDSGNLQQLLLANWCLQVGGAVQLLPLLQLQEEAVTAPEHQYCCKGNFPASTTEKVKVYTHKIV